METVSSQIRNPKRNFHNAPFSGEINAVGKINQFLSPPYQPGRSHTSYSPQPPLLPLPRVYSSIALSRVNSSIPLPRVHSCPPKPAGKRRDRVKKPKQTVSKTEANSKTKLYRTGSVPVRQEPIDMIIFDCFPASVYTLLSPPPSSLPLPSFSLKPKMSCKTEAAGGDDGAAKDLRRLLQLR